MFIDLLRPYFARLDMYKWATMANPLSRILTISVVHRYGVFPLLRRVSKG